METPITGLQQRLASCSTTLQSWRTLPGQAAAASIASDSGEKPMAAQSLWRLR